MHDFPLYCLVCVQGTSGEETERIMGILSQVHDLETTEEDISDQDQVIPHTDTSFENGKEKRESHFQDYEYDGRGGCNPDWERGSNSED